MSRHRLTIKLIFPALLALTTTAYAGDDCPSRVAAWLHWDTEHHQAVLCSYPEAYLIRENDDSDVRIACTLPEPRESTASEKISRVYSQLPLYSSGAIQCLQRQIIHLQQHQYRLERRLGKL